MQKMTLNLLEKGKVCWTDSKKKVLGSCRAFATDRRFSHEMSYLNSVGYIRKRALKVREFLTRSLSMERLS